MPEEYVALRNALIRQGLKVKAAKTQAAKIYNSKHPGAPVTNKPHK